MIIFGDFWIYYAPALKIPVEYSAQVVCTCMRTFVLDPVRLKIFVRGRF